MNKANFTKFTATEWEILEHRLDVPDAVGACVAESMGLPEDCQDVDPCSLRRKIEAVGGVDFATLSEIEREILKDCLDGSTFFADSEDAVATKEITRQKLSAQHRAADSLEAKFTAAGIEVYCSRH